MEPPLRSPQLNEANWNESSQPQEIRHPPPPIQVVLLEFASRPPPDCTADFSSDARTDAFGPGLLSKAVHFAAFLNGWKKHFLGEGGSMLLLLSLPADFLVKLKESLGAQ